MKKMINTIRLLPIATLLLALLQGCSEGGSVGSGISDGNDDWQTRQLTIQQNNSDNVLAAMNYSSSNPSNQRSLRSKALTLFGETGQTNCDDGGTQTITQTDTVEQISYQSCRNDLLNDGDITQYDGTLRVTVLDDSFENSSTAQDYIDYQQQQVSSQQTELRDGRIVQTNQLAMTIQPDDVNITYLFRGITSLQQFELTYNQQQRYYWEQVQYQVDQQLRDNYPTDHPCYQDSDQQIVTADGIQYIGLQISASGFYASEALGGGFNVSVLEPMEYCIGFDDTGLTMHFMRGKMQLSGADQSNATIEVLGLDQLQWSGDNDGDGTIDYQKTIDRNAIAHFFMGYLDWVIVQ